MTPNQILETLARQGKKVKRCQLYRYFKAAGIKPQGARQRPQIYPADSLNRLVQYLGLETEPHRRSRLSQSAGIITMKQIKAGRGK